MPKTGNGLYHSRRNAPSGESIEFTKCEGNEAKRTSSLVHVASRPCNDSTSVRPSSQLEAQGGRSSLQSVVVRLTGSRDDADDGPSKHGPQHTELYTSG